jgi:hypothetical protein
MTVVVRSMELERILAMPRRVIEIDKIPDVTAVFRRPGGTMSFWPLQSAALIEAAEANGLIGAIGVGGGKSLISYAIASAMDSKKAVLLVPPELRDKARREIPEYQKHFELPVDRLRIVAYSELSSASGADILDQECPDLIIADECHCLSHSSAARTRRFMRFFREHPACRFVGLSGSITRRSIVDYAHLVELALRKNSPIPVGWSERQDWASALDVNPMIRFKPGQLMRLCPPGTEATTENARLGYMRRLTETHGIIATQDEELQIGLRINKPICPTVPQKVLEKMDEVRKTWSIDGEEFDSAMALARTLRQLSCGFYYRWAWPNGAVDHEWLEARRAWHREVRDFLSHRSRPGLDSPGLLARAAEKGSKEGGWDALTWAAWAKVKDRRAPPTEAVWIDDFVIKQTAHMFSCHECEAPDGLIVWYSSVAIGERFKELGYPVYDAGKDAETATEPKIVCSIRAQGTGKNLQKRYHRNLYLEPPVSSLDYEQTIGRTHRPGQVRDEVVIDWLGHAEFADAMDRAIEDAKYVKQTLGQTQKILMATRL